LDAYSQLEANLTYAAVLARCVEQNGSSSNRRPFSEGIQFYTNFQELLQKFKQRCSDFVVARRTEKQEMLTYVPVLSHVSFETGTD
jgi:hypothetical protein